MSLTLTTKRCVLNTITQDNFSEVRQLYLNSEVREFLGGTISPKVFVEKFETLLQDTGTQALVIHLQPSREFVGLITLEPHHGDTDTEISFQILPEFWGQGLAHETVAAVIAYAFDTLELPWLIAETQMDNDRSRMLLHLLGMKSLRYVRRFGVKQTILKLTNKKAGHLPGL